MPPTLALPLTHASLNERLKDKPLEFTPGEKFKYSNSGYYLLGVIIERASGKPYADFLRENIFGPLGMARTGNDDNSRVIKNRANGYEWRGDRMVNGSYLDMTNFFAAGSLFSTTEDLLLWDKALYTEKLIPRKSLDEMFTPFKDGYGYGWGVRELSGRQVLGHSGGLNGFFTHMARFPADRVTIIVLVNNTVVEAGGVAADLSAIVFGAPYKIPHERKAITLDSRTLRKYVGQYQPPSASVITITYENGKLMRQVGQQPKVEMFAESETEFFLKGTDLRISFVMDAQGNVAGQLLRRGGREVVAQKVK